ncbi:TetR family transcriptional regulator [Pandoraea sp. NPDC090278]|uniref:TetR family transcriptional regulator n=1 Tax=Pandoraea sp. NPDC090278 TaxID=3364391 RepID=UPI00383A71F1
MTPDLFRSGGFELSVIARVRAALALMRDQGRAHVSVVEVCKAAGVSRANLYAHHRYLIEEILELGGPRIPSKRRGSMHEEAPRNLGRLAGRDAQYRALLLVCVEQQAEIAWLQAQLRSSSRARNGKGRTTRSAIESRPSEAGTSG